MNNKIKIKDDADNKNEHLSITYSVYPFVEQQYRNVMNRKTLNLILILKYRVRGTGRDRKRERERDREREKRVISFFRVQTGRMKIFPEVI